MNDVKMNDVGDSMFRVMLSPIFSHKNVDNKMRH